MTIWEENVNCLDSVLRTTPERIVFLRIRGELERQLHHCGAPEEIHEFLTQHWARLMTDIFMAKGNQDPDWQAGWDTVNALLWSLAPKQGRKETALLLKTLPSLLARLQEGCTALGLPGSERDAFFERLAILHAAVAREGMHEGVSLTPDETGAPAPRDLGGVPDVDFSRLPAPLQGSADAAMAPDPDAGGQPLPALTLGCRIRLRVGLQDKILLLNWVSPMGGMYMFTNEEGRDALTLTRARLEAKFRLGEAQLLS